MSEIHAPDAAGVEHFVLLRHREPAVERQDLGAFQVSPREDARGVADFPFSREEHQHVARAFPEQFLYRVAERLLLLVPGRVLLVAAHRPVADFDRVQAAGNFDACGHGG